MSERLIELERADAVREAYDALIRVLSHKHVNDQYRKAFNLVISIINNELRGLPNVTQTETDIGAQVSDMSEASR